MNLFKKRFPLKVKDIINNSSIWIPGSLYGLDNPKVSVLLPTFRRAASGLFENAVLSVLNQSFRDLELIIVDDCSYDGTFDLIKHYMELDGRVSCIRHSYNIGLPAVSEYEAYLRARGTYIAFLFDDNEWEPGAIEQTYERMFRENIKASYGVIELVLPNASTGHMLGTSDIDTIRLNNTVANGSVVLHRDVIEDIGLYDPHLSIMRVCDWDLWNRIVRKHDFVRTDIFFGKEYGPLQSDSLGNTALLEAWFSAEHMAQPRNELLKPAQFSEYSIVESFGARSSYYVFCIKEFCQRMQQKPWYQPLTIPQVNPNHRHILVLIDAPSASLVSFDRAASRDLTVRFASLFHLYEADLTFADAVIIPRDNINGQRHLELIKGLNIPVYYYTDDNFLALAVQDPHNVSVRELAEANKHDKLERYNGVIVSSEQMLLDFRERNLHDHLILLEPVINAKLLPDHSAVQKPYFSVAFLGGSFRSDVLQHCVLPALTRLSDEIPVRLYCPNDFDLSVYSTERFETVSVPRTNNLDLILTKFCDFAPDVQVHCGKALPNNRFKTENALINATIIGAVLLSSEIEPYISGANQNCYMLAANTVDCWYQKLKQLAEDSGLRKQIYQNAKAYCLSRYDSNRVWAALEKELVSYPELSTYTAYKRLEKIIFHLRYRHTPPIPQPAQATNWEIFRLFWKKYGVLTLFIAVWKVVKKSTLWLFSKFKRN
ncbi:MAG: hypothetical protein C0413_03925 [Clostridiales bacterium]|nr:hypothetical protein [Clostridiales bacterium]